VRPWQDHEHDEQTRDRASCSLEAAKAEVPSGERSTDCSELPNANDAPGNRARAKAEPADFETPATRALCEKIAELSGGVALLGFSRGKDSVAAWLYLLRFFDRIIPFHCSSVPHLGFVDRSLNYYETFFGTKIHRFMDGAVLGDVYDLIWQPPTAEAELDRLRLFEFSRHALAARLMDAHGVPDAWIAWGINASDSIDRQIYVKKYQGRVAANRSFYPTFDWKRADIMRVLDAAGVKLAGDYLIANRTLAGVPTYRHAARMRDVYPEDWDRVLCMFPMLEAELARQEFRRERFDLLESDAPSKSVG